MKKNTFGFAGLGLIGGSIAKALRNAYPACTIIAYDPDRSALEAACAEAIVDRPAGACDEHFTDCDYLFLCAPVADNGHNLNRLRQYLAPQCLITDVGSVKTPIHQEIIRLGLEAQFIGGHPMTGSERSGYNNAKAVLLENAYYILTPTPRVPPGSVANFRKLIRNIKALPLVMSAAEHDHVTAAVSHLPHIIAAALVGLVKDNDSPAGLMKMIAAGGFKDITRIASSSPVMWQQICLNNRENISRLLEKYINALTSVNEEVKAADSAALMDFFTAAGNYRDSLPDTVGGPIQKSHTLYVDIPDKAGTLAAIVTLLSDHDINIKNIGISHNREAEAGVLLIEFYDAGSVTGSGRLLTAAGYSFYAGG